MFVVDFGKVSMVLWICWSIVLLFLNGVGEVVDNLGEKVWEFWVVGFLWDWLFFD